MAKRTKMLSIAEQREVLRYETWLTATSGFRFEKNNRRALLPTTSIYGKHDLKVDAVLVVGDNFRAAAEAAVFLRYHKKRHGSYPKIICSPGFSVPNVLDFGYPPEWWLKIIMLRLGVPREALNNQKQQFERFDPCQSLADFLEKQSQIKTAVVFSSRGYSMAVAQELYQRIPQINWVFFDNPVIPIDERVLDSENIVSEGVGIDLLIGGIVHVWQDWQIVRYPLSLETRNNAPEEAFLKVFIQKGYVLGLSDNRDWDFFGTTASVYRGILLERMECLKTGREARQHVRRQVESLIGQYEYLV